MNEGWGGGEAAPRHVGSGEATGIWGLETRQAAQQAAVPTATQSSPMKNYPALRELKLRMNPWVGGRRDPSGCGKTFYEVVPLVLSRVGLGLGMEEMG